MAIAVSEAWKELIKKNRPYLFKAEVTLKSGETLEIQNSDVKKNSVKTEDATSDSGNFAIGSAIINELRFSLNNFDDKFTQYDFDGAVIKGHIGLRLPGGNEWIQKGKYTVVDAKESGSLITITGEDDMRKFDAAFDSSVIAFPCTLEALVQKGAEVCGVSIGANALGDYGSTYTVDTAPTARMTWREIISYAAQICCKFARMSNTGVLQFKWYASKADGQHDKITTLFSQDITRNDVVITGVNVESTDTTEDVRNYTYGEAGYILPVYDNPLIPYTKVKSVAENIGKQVVGMTFRPLEVTALSDPSIEAGDIVIVRDKKGNELVTNLTDCSFTMGGRERFSCGANPPERQATTRYAEREKVQQDYSYLEDQYKDLETRMNDFENQSFSSPAVTNLQMASDHFVVTFEDASVKTYTYSVDASGLITNITLMG